jgi:hypothetical protein
MDDVTDAIPLMQVPVGECVYIRGTIFWATATPSGSDRLLILPGCPSLVGFDNNTMVYVVTPLFKPAKRVVEKPEVEAEVESVVPDVDPRQLELPLTEETSSPQEVVAPHVEPANSQPSAEVVDLHNPIGTVVGQAAMADVGVVPVLYLGSFFRGGKALYPNLTALWQRRKEPFYGAALSGRSIEGRRLQILSVWGESQHALELKSSIGNVVWQQVEEAVLALSAKVQEASK